MNAFTYIIIVAGMNELKQIPHHNIFIVCVYDSLT